MRRFWILIIFIMTGYSFAQTATMTVTPTLTPTMTPLPRGDTLLTCDGLPCGDLIWSLPDLPALLSPTPRPIVNSNISPADTATAMSLVAIENTFLIATNVYAPTPTGTPYISIGANVGTFFSYVSAVRSTDFGVLSPLLTFLFLVFSFTIALKLITIVIPVISVIIGVIRKLIELIPGM